MQRAVAFFAVLVVGIALAGCRSVDHDGVMPGSPPDVPGGGPDSWRAESAEPIGESRPDAATRPGITGPEDRPVAEVEAVSGDPVGTDAVSQAAALSRWLDAADRADPMTRTLLLDQMEAELARRRAAESPPRRSLPEHTPPPQAVASPDVPGASDGPARYRVADELELPERIRRHAEPGAVVAASHEPTSASDRAAPAPESMVHSPDSPPFSDPRVGVSDPANGSTENSETAATESSRRLLRRTIQALRRESEADVDSVEDLPWRNEALTRLMLTAAGDADQAAVAIEGLNEEEQQFWQSQCMALHAMLDPDGPLSPSRRYALALRHLRDAESHLATVSTLDLPRLVFCESVDSFGVFREIRSARFKPNEPVILYVEVRNFAVEEIRPALVDPRAGFRPGSDTWYESELHGRYEIVGSAGRRIDEQILEVDKQRCLNFRSDYYLAYMIHMPADIAEGDYRLHVTIEDVKGDKFGVGTLDFSIR